MFIRKWFVDGMQKTHIKKDDTSTHREREKRLNEISVFIDETCEFTYMTEKFIFDQGVVKESGDMREWYEAPKRLLSQ